MSLRVSLRVLCVCWGMFGIFIGDPNLRLLLNIYSVLSNLDMAQLTNLRLLLNGDPNLRLLLNIHSVLSNLDMVQLTNLRLLLNIHSVLSNLDMAHDDFIHSVLSNLDMAHDDFDGGVRKVELF